MKENNEDKKNILLMKSPNYNNSPYIDEDIKEFFKDKLYYSDEMLNLQLIKSIKELNKNIKLKNENN